MRVQVPAALAYVRLRAARLGAAAHAAAHAAACCWLPRALTRCLLPHPAAPGGWAGGEAGLWQLREQVLKEMDGKNKGSSSAASSSSSKATQPPRPKDGLAPIYVGYGKE